LPTTFKKISTGKPKLQGNRIFYKRLGTTKSKGGFNVKESVEGPLLGRCKNNYKSLYVHHKLRDLKKK
jgi:hypothetical protein